MSWEARILPTSETPDEAVEALFADQLERWDLLARGVDGLGRASSRSIDLDGTRLWATHIPHRIRSTTARVDDASIRERPCFLCPANLPPEERGVAFGEFVLTCNPYPIRDRHLSIVSREHRPQRAVPDFPSMLDLASALPGYLVLYNGGRCGASAPDHMHFQACLVAGLPLIEAMSSMRAYPVSHVELTGSDRASLTARFGTLMARLEELGSAGPEPMVNVIAVHGPEGWRVVVFPRRAHRPGMYASGELVWSPGALDLAGILVLPREADLERVTPALVRQGFSEVCVPPEVARRLAREIAA